MWLIGKARGSAHSNDLVLRLRQQVVLGEESMPRRSTRAWPQISVQWKGPPTLLHKYVSRPGLSRIRIAHPPVVAVQDGGKSDLRGRHWSEHWSRRQCKASPVTVNREALGGCTFPPDPRPFICPLTRPPPPPPPSFDRTNPATSNILIFLLCCHLALPFRCRPRHLGTVTFTGIPIRSDLF